MLLTAADLRPGVRFKYNGHPVEILREREKRKDRFGQTLDSWWSRRIDTGDEGYVSLGTGGVLRVELLKTPPAQLDREIAEALSSPKKKRRKRTRAHAVIGSVGRGSITEEQARSMPRFDFIAHWLAVVTRKKENRDLAKGKRVRRVGDRWQIVYSNGLVEYETPDTDRLFDYARRGPLGWHIRNAEEFRILAHERGSR